MNKCIYIFLFLVVLFNPVFSSNKIEVGDELHVFIVDTKGVDLIANNSLSSGARDVSRDSHLVRVANDGRIYIPISRIGDLSVLGKTEADVEAMIKNKITFPYSNLAVLIMNPKFNRITVMGEVRAPSVINISTGQPKEMTLINVISRAGGFTDRADLSHIKINTTRTIDLHRMYTSATCNVELSDGDTVIVPQATSRVYVLGEVHTPGGYPYIEGANFVDYIAEAGGILPSADRGNIGILRRSSDDQVVVVKTSLSGDLVGQCGHVFKSGDLIYVPRSFFADWGAVISAFGLIRDSVYVYTTLK